MKKTLPYLALLFVSLILIGAGPTSEQGNVIYFAAADQETTTKFRIRAVVWSSNEGSNLDIAADDDFLLEDADGSVIVGKRAEPAGAGLTVYFGERGVVASGLKVEELDGGVVFVYGDRL